MNVMQKQGTDLTYGSVPGDPRAYKTFFSLHLRLAGKYCENPKVPKSRFNVNPARAITWLVGIGVARIFDWGKPKPQLTCNDVIRNFKREIFCGGKDIVEWEIRSRGLDVGT